jgi:replication fork clamp-binding protein CrfC
MIQSSAFYLPSLLNVSMPQNLFSRAATGIHRSAGDSLEVMCHRQQLSRIASPYPTRALLRWRKSRQ